jgi:HECT-domain (ubiquitin-transferase)
MVPERETGVKWMQDFFKFVGRVVGKALHDGQLIDAHFTRSFYK